MQMVIIKGDGFEIQVPLRKLDKEMDECLAKLMTDFYLSKNQFFEAINQTLLQGFEKDAFKYLDRRYQNGADDLFKMQDFLFNNLTIISNFYLGSHLYKDAEDFWQRIMDIVNKWEVSRGLRVHKGSIYYFWAGVALLNNEVDKGFFLIHKAYLEDCITHGGTTPGTPAYKTVMLNVEDENNMLYGYVLGLWDFLFSYIENYNNANNRKLTKELVYAKFISNPPSPDILFSFSHSIAKIKQLIEFQPNITQSSFAGLLELNLLFDLVLIADNLYYSQLPLPKIRKDWVFGRIIKQLLLDAQIEKTEIPINQNLKAINDSIEDDFNLTINSLCDRSFQFPAHANITPLYFDALVSYSIRNHSAHNITLNESISQKFEYITQCIFNTLFLCIETM
jgi:hypothetical protein